MLITNTVVGSGPLAGSCYIHRNRSGVGFCVFENTCCLIKSTRVAYSDHGIMVAAVS